MYFFFNARPNVLKLKCFPFLFLILFCLFLLYFFHSHLQVERVPVVEGEPPLPLPSYTTIYDMEKALPQHNLDLPFPEGRYGRYIRFSTQPSHLGWNNVLNEMQVFCSVVSNYEE